MPSLTGSGGRPRPPDPSVEGVALVDAPAIVTTPEPLLPLGRGAVVEAFRHDIALCPALDCVVADLRSGVERLVDVARLQKPLVRGIVCPDPGKAVGL